MASTDANQNPKPIFFFKIQSLFSNMNMVDSLPKLIFLFLFFLGFASADCHTFSRSISPSILSLEQQELTHLHFYFHDIFSGQNPTTVRVAEAPITNNSLSDFGAVLMTDGPLTLEPELSSKTLGRAQGMYASASQSELSFLMVLNFAFTEGEYNDSSLSVLGRNTLSSAVREMPIVGGSGLFRFARGYAQARTQAIDFKTGNAIEEFDVYVFHY